MRHMSEGTKKPFPPLILGILTAPMLADCRYRVIDPHFPQMEPGTRDLGEIWCTPIEQA